MVSKGPQSTLGATRRSLALDVVDVSVGYSGSTVVNGLTFELSLGDWLVIIGPNGAGKTTVLKTIVGIMEFSGELAILGRPQTGRAAEARTVAYVPQHPVLPAGMSVAEYVLLGRTAHLGWFGSESAADRRRAADVLDQLDLGSVAGRPVTELSGGEAQRVSVARALVQEAQILVLDEPTSSLDLSHAMTVLELVDELRHAHDLAVISAMHDLTLAGRFGDRMLLLSDGQSVATGGPDDVLNDELLTAHYRTPIAVIDGPDGCRVVVPQRVPLDSGPK